MATVFADPEDHWWAPARSVATRGSHGPWAVTRNPLTLDTGSQSRGQRGHTTSIRRRRSIERRYLEQPGGWPLSCMALSTVSGADSPAGPVTFRRVIWRPGGICSGASHVLCVSAGDLLGRVAESQDVLDLLGGL